MLLVPLLLGVGPTTAPTTAPTSRPVHDRDPWVFRCVLDGNARSVVVSLGDHRWAAYDAATCALTKVWHGDIELTGAVYDYKHGPQPRAQGKILLDRPAAITRPGSIITGISTNLGQEGATTQPASFVDGLREVLSGPWRFDYRGYSIRDGLATLHYVNGDLRIDEQASIRVADGDKTVLVRTISTREDGFVMVDLPTSKHVESIKLVEGSIRLNVDKRTGGTLVQAPADIPFDSSKNSSVGVSGAGRVVIETTLRSD